MIVGGLLIVAFGVFLIWGARDAAENRVGDYKRNRRLRRKEKSRLTRWIMWEKRPPSVRAGTIRTRIAGGLIVALGVGLIVGPELIG